MRQAIDREEWRKASSERSQGSDGDCSAIYGWMDKAPYARRQ